MLWGVQQVEDCRHHHPDLIDKTRWWITAFPKVAVSAAHLGSLASELEQALERTELGEQRFTAERLTLASHFFAVHACRRALQGDYPDEPAQFALRDLARLTALVKGVDGAVPFCVGLARQLDL